MTLGQIAAIIDLEIANSKEMRRLPTFSVLTGFTDEYHRGRLHALELVKGLVEELDR